MAQKQQKQYLPAGRVLTPEKMIERLMKIARFIERRTHKRVVKDYDKHYLKIQIKRKYASLVKFFRKVYKGIIAEMAEHAGVQVYRYDGPLSETFGYRLPKKKYNHLKIHLTRDDEFYYIDIRAYDDNEWAGL